jgi:hypothetical protein
MPKSSRHTSTTSSLSVLSENAFNTLQDLETTIPVNPDEAPSFYREYTHKHPLGQILLDLKAHNIEMAKLAGIPARNEDLELLCQQFVHALKAERDHHNHKFNKKSSALEASLLNKELQFADVTQTIQPPTHFSPTSVLKDNPSKLAECIKLFPKGTQRFSGRQGSGINIIEFLKLIALAQETCMLSEDEFKAALLRSCTDGAHTLIAEQLEFGFDLNDIYHSLLLNYDRRLSPAEARKDLLEYKAPKNSNLAKVVAYIMNKAGRISSSLPKGEGKLSLYNLDATNALEAALPPASRTLVINQKNLLITKLGRLPQFAELIRSLQKYSDSIDTDIRAHGVGQTSNYRNKPVYSAKTYTLGQGHRQTLHRDHTKKKTDINSRLQQLAAGRLNRSSNFKPKVNAVMNQGTRQYYKPSYNNNNNSGASKRKYCSLCGLTSHNAANTCYRMIDNDNKVVRVVPTFDPCQLCLKVKNKRLYHPSTTCLSRPNHPRYKNNNKQ